MLIKKHHYWNLNYKGAVEIQKKLAKKIILYDDISPVKRIAGVDVKFLLSLSSAIKFTLDVSKFRIPEPIKLAYNYLQEYS